MLENDSLSKRLKSAESELLLSNQSLEATKSAKRKIENERDNYGGINETLTQELKEKDKIIAAQRAILDSLPSGNDLIMLDQTKNMRAVDYPNRLKLFFIETSSEI